MATARISLNSPVFSGRLRTFDRRSTYERRDVVSVRPRIITDIRSTVTSKPKLVNAAKIRRQTLSAVKPAVRTNKSLVLKRQIVSQPFFKASKPAKRHKSSLHKKALTVLAILLFVVGIGVAVDGLLTNRHVEAQVEHLQTSGGNTTSDGPMVGDVPAESDKPDVSAYRAAANLPRVISIPKLDVTARVLRLGANSQGALAAPASIYDTGWYEASSKPGESGAMLIDGHVHGPTKPGVFSELKNLKAGDEITIERGDGKVISYKVIKTKTYPADSMDMMGAALTPVTPGKPGLNLITCTGEIDKSNNHYKDRLVVFAEQK